MYPVVVENGRNQTKWYAFRLQNMGLVRDNANGKFRGKCESKRELNKIKRYCKRKHLKFYINNSYGTRSSDYRKVFFESNKPLLSSFYFCAYCGKLVRRKKITVDHLFPIAKAQKELSLQRKLKWLGIDSINSEKNLVPACEKCNKRKGTKIDGWIIKGYIGKIQWLWIPRWIVRISATIVLITLLVRFWNIYPSFI